MSALIDITGQRFNRLVVLRRAAIEDGGNLRWECRCDCGNITTSLGSHLKNGGVKSCGCLLLKAGEQTRTHGFTASQDPLAKSTYAAWANMIDRCVNPKAKAYKNYGGRGIRVCERWRGSFEAFVEDIGVRPSKDHSLDRYPDVNGGYEPSNCRWATASEQTRNTRKTVFIEFEGRRVALADAADKNGLKHTTVKERLKRGWPVEEALTLKVMRAGKFSDPLRRDYVSLETKLAAALLALGHIPHCDAGLMTADQIISLYEFDHYPIRHADGGSNHPSNLRPLGIMEHRKKTAEVDAPAIAKGRRLRGNEALHRAHMASKAGNYKLAAEILATAPKPGRLKAKKKIPSRPFGKVHRPLRSRSSFERRA